LQSIKNLPFIAIISAYTITFKNLSEKEIAMIEMPMNITGIHMKPMARMGEAE
jgi:hypothetical protein